MRLIVARERAASCNRVQNLGYRTNKYWRICHCRSEPILLLPSPHVRPAQASLTLRPAGSLSRLKRPLSRGSSPSGCRSSRSSATGSIDNSPGGISSTDDLRLRGALPLPDLNTLPISHIRRYFPPARSGKVVSHGRYVAFQMAEVAMPALSHPLPRHVILHTM